MTVRAGLEPVAEAFQQIGQTDPTYSGQLAAYHRGELVLDLTIGDGLRPDSLLPVFSSSKGVTGIVIALLVQRGLLDLDERVATYWPEFAQNGKESITLRVLLSHQAGLLGVDGGYTTDELLAHTPLAEKLAAQRPLWFPGTAFAYHALTIGTLADELVRRTDGRTLSQVFAQDLAGPRAVDVHLGTPEALDGRVVDVLLPTEAEMLEWLPKLPFPEPDSLGAMATPTSDVPLYLAVNEVAFRRVGPPAAGGLANARGLAKLYAGLRHDVGATRLLDDDTIAQVSQTQVTGIEIGSNVHARFGIVFQTPNPPRLAFGSGRAFGHDGAGGSLAFCDPVHDLGFGYVTQRIPLPGGVDARAIELSKLLRSLL